MKRIAVLTTLLLGLAALALIPTATSYASGTLSVTLICEPSGYGAFCEAGPFDLNNTYAFSTSGPIAVGNGSIHGAFRQVTCLSETNGTLFVVVTTPSGAQGSASRGIQCNHAGIIHIF